MWLQKDEGEVGGDCLGFEVFPGRAAKAAVAFMLIIVPWVDNLGSLRVARAA